MATSYPGAIDSLPNPTSATLENAAGFEHDIGHSNLGDAIEAIETELGTLPKGSAASVKARLNAMDTVDALRVVGSNQTTAPSSPVVGQVWVDHSTPATPVIKVWSGSAWVNPSSAGSGGAALVWATVTGGTVTTVTNPDGSTDEVHTFTANGTLTVTKAGYAEVLLVGGGGGASSDGVRWGGSGSVVSGMRTLPAGALTVVVGTGGTGESGADGNASRLGTLYSGLPGVLSSAQPGQNGYTSAISGTDVVYAYPHGGITWPSPRVNRGDGATAAGGAGSTGIVIVRVRITDALPLPAATGWAQVTGGTVTEYTKPDGSVMEVHTFTAAGSLTVVAAGYAECLVVGGGSAYQNTAAIEANGGGGDILSGLRALPAGTHAVTVGAGGTGGAPGNPTWQKVGQPSSIGAVLVTAVGRGHSGAGGTPGSASSILTPVTSLITGTALTYGQAAVTAPRANRGDGSDVGGGSPANGSAGVVIVAVQKTPPTASGVVATGGTETTFTGDGTNGVLGQGYKVHTFTADSALVVTQGGVCEALLVSGGGGWLSGVTDGAGGRVWEGTLDLAAGSIPVTVGAGGASSGGGLAYVSYPTILGSYKTVGSVGYGVDGAGGTKATPGTGITSRISGAAVTYATVGTPSQKGGGGVSGSPGGNGTAVIRYKV